MRVRTIVVLICVFVLSIGIVSASEWKIDGYSVLTNNTPIPISQVTSLQSILNSKINQSSAATCGAGEYSRWNGTAFECYVDTGGNISDNLQVVNISGKKWFNNSDWNYTRLNVTVGIFEVRDPATGNVSIGHIPYNRYDNGTGLDLFPALRGSRVGINFFTRPESTYDNGTGDNLRALAIHAHGTRADDHYNSYDNHVTFYSLDENNNSNKVIQWNWGAPEPGYPDSGWDGNITILPNMTVLHGLYVGGSSVPQYKNLPETGEPNFIVSPSTPDSSGPIGNFTKGSQWTAIMRGDTYPFFGTDCVDSCGSTGFGGVAFYVNSSLVSYFAGSNDSLIFTDATRDPDDTWVRFHTQGSGEAYTEFSKVPVKIVNTKLYVNGTEVTASPYNIVVSPSGGTSDQSNINNAINSCAGTSSCTVKLIAGREYTIDGQILISDKDNVTIDATGATVRVADNVQLADGRMLLAVNVSHFKITGGKWDGNNEHSTDPLNTDRRIFQVYNYAPHVSEDIVIEDTLLVNTTNSAFNETLVRRTAGIEIGGDGEYGDIQILNNRMYNVGGGINLLSAVTSGTAFRGVLIKGNIIDSHILDAHGIDIRDGDSYGNSHNRDITVVGNYVNLHQSPNNEVTGGEIGIYVKGESVTITGNVVYRSGLEGITAMGKQITVSSNTVKNVGDNGIDTWICEDCLVDGNIVDNPYYDGIATWAAHNVIVSDNVISNVTNHTTFGNYGVAVHHELSDNYPNTRYVIIRDNQFINTYGGVSVYPFGGSGALVDPNIVVIGNDLRQVTNPSAKIHDPYNKISVRYNNIGDSIDYADNNLDMNGKKLLNAETITAVNPSTPTANFTVSLNTTPKIWVNGSYPFFTANEAGSGFGGFQWVYNGVSKSYMAQTSAYMLYADDTTDEHVYRIYNNDTGAGGIITYYPVDVTKRLTIPHGLDNDKGSSLISAGDIYFATDTNKLYIYNGTAVVSSQFS